MLAAPARAQVETGQIFGRVTDTSGAVLPGVTVEAASPVLIERVRTTVTDGEGRYAIVDLRPGTYSVTFTLPGFSTVRRDALEVTSGFTVPVNAELTVGAVEETITVTGESPVVDTQTSTRRQVVLSNEVIQAIPASRGYGNLLATVPGIQATGLDVSSGVSTNFFTARGGRGNEGTIQIDGMNVGSAFNGGGVANGAVPTPNIDSIGREGVSFANGYAGNATCAPSRAAIMTGRYPRAARVQYKPDARIEAIVRTWPVRFRTPRALAMGFAADPDIAHPRIEAAASAMASSVALERANALADGARRQVEPPGRGLEGSLLGDRHEGLELGRVEAHSSVKHCFTSIRNLCWPSSGPTPIVEGCPPSSPA